jgi:hypothetical protein
MRYESGPPEQSGRFVLSSGRWFYASSVNLLGPVISSGSPRLVEGYDAHVSGAYSSDDGDPSDFTPFEQAEIADYMIGLWRQWGNAPNAFRADERSVPARVTVAFNPATLTGTLCAVWRDDVARTLWLAYKWKHLVSQHFDQDCLAAARALRATPPTSVEKLRRTLCGACGFGRTWDWLARGDEAWYAQVFPILRDGLKIPYAVDG